jgi:hypothetical protein
MAFDDLAQLSGILKLMQRARVEGVMVQVDDSPCAPLYLSVAEHCVQALQLCVAKFALSEQCVIPVQLLGHGVQADERNCADDIELGIGYVHIAKECAFERCDVLLPRNGTAAIIVVTRDDENRKTRRLQRGHMEQRFLVV